MELAEFYSQLSMGTLRNIAMGNEGNGTISVNYRPTVCMYINEGLNRIHSQFLLRENDLILQMYMDVTNYHLLKRFATYAGNEVAVENQEARRYILDLPEDPFKEDVAKIMRVFDQNGTEFAINDEFNTNSVYTPQQQILQIPNPEEEKVVTVGYQALHPKIVHDDEDAFIFLPPHLLDALKAFVGYKAYSDMNQKDSRERAQELLGMYQGISDEILLKDLVSQSPGNNYTPFSERGFV
jgi:hypothetical protein